LKVLLAYHRRRHDAVGRKGEAVAAKGRNGAAETAKIPVLALFGAVPREKRPVKV